MILSRRRFLVRAGLVAAAAPFIVRPESLMKIVAPKLEVPVFGIVAAKREGDSLAFDIWYLEGFDQFGKRVAESVRVPRYALLGEAQVVKFDTKAREITRISIS